MAPLCLGAGAACGGETRLAVLSGPLTIPRRPKYVEDQACRTDLLRESVRVMPRRALHATAHTVIDAPAPWNPARHGDAENFLKLSRCCVRLSLIHISE